jgi:hypothetical protein
MSATSARRVVTFLPPHGATSSVGNRIGASREKENAVPAVEDFVRDQSRAARRSVSNPLAYASYPSPKRSTFSPCSSPSHYQRVKCSMSKRYPTPSPPSRSRSQRGDIDNDYYRLPPVMCSLDSLPCLEETQVQIV